MPHLTEAEFDHLYKPIAGPVDTIPDEVDVCIVGGGPVGLMCANLLGHRGIRTLLLEQNATTSDQPKAIAVNCEFRRMLDWLGLAESAAEHLSGPVGIKFRSPWNFILAEVPRMMTPNGFPAMSTMSQPMFERVLLAGAERFGCVSISYATPLNGFEERGDHVELQIGGAGRGARTCRAQFVIGCDGAHSMVRKTLGIEFDGHKHTEQHLVVDLASYPDQTPDLLVDCDPRRPHISIPAPYGGRRLEFMLKPGEDANHASTPENIRTLIGTHTPYKFEDVQIVRALVYTFSERMAERFGSGRVYLAGDAAHLMPPFGGQGLNTGVRDVLNLTWKIEGVLKGTLPQSILDSYEPERRDHIRDTISFAHRMGAMTNSISWAYCALRDIALGCAKFIPPARRYIAEMRYVPQPVYAKGLFLNDRPPSMGNLVGRLFPRLPFLKEDGSPCHFDDAAGSGFMLVGVNIDATTLAEAAGHPLWARLAPKLISISTQHDSLDRFGVTRLKPADERVEKMLSGHSGDILILRPDRHVGGAARPRDIVKLFDRFRRKLLGDRSQTPAAVEETPYSGVAAYNCFIYPY